MTAQYYLFGKGTSVRAAALHSYPGAAGVSVVSGQMNEPLADLVKKYGAKEIAMMALTGTGRITYSRVLDGLTADEARKVLQRWIAKQGKEHFTYYGPTNL